MTPETVSVALSEATEVGCRVLTRRGVDAHDAAVQIGHLVEADLRGQASHGLRRLPVIAGRLDAGVTVARAELRIHADGPVRRVFDGAAGLGPPTAYRALDELLAVARERRVAVGSIHSCGHLGLLAPYVEAAARAGFVLVASSISEALVSAPGGAEAIVGTNPIAIGLPTAEHPFAVDMATSEVSVGKILDHAERGRAIPLGWGVDRDGAPATDPRAVLDGGTLSAFGGAKGFALSLALECLVAGLAGGAFGADVRGTLDTEHRPTKSDLFIVIAPPPGMAEAVSEYLSSVRASRVLAGNPPVRVPGDRAAAVSHDPATPLSLARSAWEAVLAADGGAS